MLSGKKRVNVVPSAASDVSWIFRFVLNKLSKKAPVCRKSLLLSSCSVVSALKHYRERVISSISLYAVAVAGTLGDPLVLYLHCGEKAVGCIQVTHSSRSVAHGLTGDVEHTAVNPNDGPVKRQRDMETVINHQF